MYSPHSYVTIFARTPTLAQSAWIISDIRRAFGLYGRCTGIAHSVMSKPLARPALASSALAFSGSYDWLGRFLSYDHWVGGIGFVADWAAPREKGTMIA